jgi:hypothetical protein
VSVELDRAADRLGVREEDRREVRAEDRDGAAVALVLWVEEAPPLDPVDLDPLQLGRRSADDGSADSIGRARGDVDLLVLGGDVARRGDAPPSSMLVYSPEACT